MNEIQAEFDAITEALKTAKKPTYFIWPENEVLKTTESGEHIWCKVDEVLDEMAEAHADDPMRVTNVSPESIAAAMGYMDENNL